MRKRAPISILSMGKEILKLYATFLSRAIPFTDEYLRSRFNGKEGETWYVSDGFLELEFPIFDPVLNDEGCIKIDMYKSRGHYYRYFCSFQMRDDGMLILHRQGLGYDPGDSYLVSPDGVVWKAAHKRGESVPTTDEFGHFKWSVPRDSIDDQNYEKLDTVGEELLSFVNKIKEFV